MKFLERLRHQTSKFSEPLRFSSALGRSTLPDVNKIISDVPIGWIAQGRTSKQDITTAASHEYNPRRISERLKAQIKEADLALAATTPVLGQYAPTFGWPDDTD